MADEPHRGLKDIDEAARVSAGLWTPQGLCKRLCAIPARRKGSERDGTGVQSVVRLRRAGPGVPLWPGGEAEMRRWI